METHFPGKAKLECIILCMFYANEVDRELSPWQKVRPHQLYDFFMKLRNVHLILNPMHSDLPLSALISLLVFIFTCSHCLTHRIIYHGNEYFIIYELRE